MLGHCLLFRKKDAAYKAIDEGSAKQDVVCICAAQFQTFCVFEDRLGGHVEESIRLAEDAVLKLDRQWEACRALCH